MTPSPGPYCRIAFAAPRAKIAKAYAEGGDFVCVSGLCDFWELHKNGTSASRRLRRNGKEPVAVWNTWLEDIELGAMLVIGQLADGRWIAIAEACK